MAPSAPLVAFIIGSGKNVGQHTAAALKAEGYKVALGSHNPAALDSDSEDGYFRVAVDAGSPASIQSAFAEVNKELGVPSVVVFNAMAFTPIPITGEPLSLSVEAFKAQTDLGVGLFAAAQAAVAGFRAADLPKDTIKNTFIATGNSLPWIPVGRAAEDPLFVYFGANIQKTIQQRVVEFLAHADPYAEEGIRFYFATLVGPTGGMISSYDDFANSGSTHA
ncbi:hypothetical protein C8R46DRAFT_1312859 [Mycena filopes]|nr:hypothetical protein C8R46DRAFT_1312859 [Mycena filopes]